MWELNKQQESAIQATGMRVLRRIARKIRVEIREDTKARRGAGESAKESKEMERSVGTDGSGEVNKEGI